MHFLIRAKNVIHKIGALNVLKSLSTKTTSIASFAITFPNRLPSYKPEFIDKPTKLEFDDVWSFPKFGPLFPLHRRDFNLLK